MAEVKISAFSKQCLDHRIGNWVESDREIAHWFQQRNQQRAKIEWQFTTIQAQEKLSRHYDASRS